MDIKERTATLNLSEHFYSVQCEGASTGYPAYFIRLKGCNLMCGGKDGSLMKEGKATWWCDSEAVWRQGSKTDFDVLIDAWKEQDILKWVLNGRVHLIWTGGEPTMKKHQESIVSCINYLQNDCTGDEFDYFNPINLYNEIETNGTQYINDELFDKLDQINCSVKLANSGMSKEKRIVPESLERITSHDGHWFKFVVSEEEDLNEIENDFIKPFNIDPKRVLMMPGLDLKIVDDPNGPASADRVGAMNTLLIGDDESVTIRGITNSNQVSAATSSGSGLIYYRTQFYSINPSR